MKTRDPRSVAQGVETQRRRWLQRSLMHTSKELVLIAVSQAGRRLSIGELRDVMPDMPLVDLKSAVVLAVQEGRLVFAGGLCSLPSVG